MFRTDSIRKGVGLVVPTLLTGSGSAIVKDDELIADPPDSPLNERIPAVMERSSHGRRNGWGALSRHIRR